MPATSTHYDHGAQPRSKVFDFFPEGGKPDSLENPRGTAENQRTTQLTYMAPTGNRTGVTLVRGERFTHKPTDISLRLFQHPYRRKFVYYFMTQVLCPQTRCFTVTASLRPLEQLDACEGTQTCQRYKWIPECKRLILCLKKFCCRL